MYDNITKGYIEINIEYIIKYQKNFYNIFAHDIFVQKMRIKVQ